MQLEQRRRDDEGDVGEDVGDSLHRHVNRAAVVALDRAVERADDHVDRGDEKGENDGKARADADGHEQILAHGVRAEDVEGLVAVEIPVIVVVAHAALHGAGLGGGVGVAAVVAGNADAVVLRAGVGGIRGVDGDEIALLVQLRGAGGVHLIPDIRVVRDVMDVLGVHIGVDDLDPVLILPLLDALELRVGEHLVDDADLVVVVGLDGIGEFLPLLAAVHDRGGGGAENIQHGVVAGLLRDAAPVIHRLFVLAGTGHGAVKGAVLLVCDGADIGSKALVALVLVRDLVGGDDGRNDREQEKEADDERRGHAGLVLAEAEERVREIAAGLGFQLGVVQAGVHLRKLEFFGGNMLIFHLIHIYFTHFFDPILMRGSIKP